MPVQPMTRVLRWLLLLLLFGIFAGVVYRALRERVASGKGMPQYSIFSEERDGLAPAAQPLRKLGWEPVAVTQPIQYWQQEANGNLLLLAEPVLRSWLPGQSADMSDTDVDGLLRWVQRGNTLLFCSRQMSALHRALNLVLQTDARVDEDMTTHVVLGEAGGYTSRVEQIVVEGRDVLRGGGDLPLWWVDNDPGAVVMRRGRGRVIVVADPSILTLRGLRRADNLRFLVNVVALHAGDGRVYFDEYHHGLRSGGGFWGYLHAHGQQWIVLVIILVAGMAAWGVGIRLGRPVPALDEKQADAVEYASAVARIYQQAGVQHLLAETLCRDFLTDLTRHLRLRRGVLPAEILAAWQKQHPRDKAQELEPLLRGVSVLRSKTVSAGQLLSWAKNFDRFRTEVLRAG
ncbi:MAG TPA: DUF4350 domain-containing protein [Gemmataceae bacterium]|nr:DUF4350 domain-containing protein [Gemmataceae bacterium]